jgi:hypothetical protein
MKYFYYLLFAAQLIVLTSQEAISQAKPKQKTNMKKQASSKLYRHIVLFKFKDSASDEDIKSVETAFTALPSKINTIVGYEWGTNVSPENLAQGFTHCFLLTFRNEAGRDYYLPHPAHKEFGRILGPHLDKVLVIDFIDRGK